MADRDMRLFLPIEETAVKKVIMRFGNFDNSKIR